MKKLKSMRVLAQTNAHDLVGPILEGEDLHRLQEKLHAHLTYLQEVAENPEDYTIPYDSSELEWLAWTNIDEALTVVKDIAQTIDALRGPLKQIKLNTHGN
jgi:hypothetical protein